MKSKMKIVTLFMAIYGVTGVYASSQHRRTWGAPQPPFSQKLQQMSAPTHNLRLPLLNDDYFYNLMSTGIFPAFIAKSYEEISDTPQSNMPPPWEFRTYINANNKTFTTRGLKLAHLWFKMDKTEVEKTVPDLDQTPTAAYIAYNPVENVVTIVFRGTASGDINDWAVDFTMEPHKTIFSGISVTGNVHSGFLNRYESMRTELLTALTNIMIEGKETHHQYPDIYVIGHSMGAGLSQLCALDLKLKYKIKNERMEPNQIKAWLLSPPRVLDKNLATLYNENIGINNTIRQISSLDFVNTSFSYKSLGILALDESEQLAVQLTKKIMINNGMELSADEAKIIHDAVTDIKSSKDTFLKRRMPSLSHILPPPLSPSTVLKFLISRNTKVTEFIPRFPIPGLSLTNLIAISSHYGYPEDEHLLHSHFNINYFLPGLKSTDIRTLLSAGRKVVDDNIGVPIEETIMPAELFVIE